MGINLIIRLSIVIVIISCIYANNLNPPKPNNKFIINLESYENLQYYGNLNFGSHMQKSNLIFSTGSGLSWIGGKECEKCYSRYDNKISDDFKNLTSIFNYKYGMGEIEGNLVADSVKLTEEESSKLNFKFLLVKNTSENIRNLHADGVIGLGLLSDDKNLIKNFITQLYESNLISSQRFSMYISSGKYTNSKLYLGDFSQGTEIANLYKQMSYCKVDDKSKHWECEFDSIHINKTNIPTSSKIRIDTGVSYLIIPLIDYKIIKKHFVDVVKSECVRNENNQLLCKCDSPSIFPDIKLSLGVSYFTINTRELVDYISDQNVEYQCRFHIQIDMENESTWTIGTSAMKNSLFSFDITKKIIGFVQNPKNPDVYGNKENVLIKNDREEESSKIGFIFTFAFLILIMVGLYKCANNDPMFSYRSSNSLDNNNFDDNKKLELIKNRFNTEEYDYDDVNTGKFDIKGTQFEMKELTTDK